jgi:hypothetical protein
MKRYGLLRLLKDEKNAGKMVESFDYLSTGYSLPSVPMVGKSFTCGSFKTSSVLKVNLVTGIFETRNEIYRVEILKDVSPVEIKRVNVSVSPKKLKTPPVIVVDPVPVVVVPVEVHEHKEIEESIVPVSHLIHQSRMDIMNFNFHMKASLRDFDITLTSLENQ